MYMYMYVCMCVCVDMYMYVKTYLLFAAEGVVVHCFYHV